MVKDRDTTVGYHCPFCGMSILNRINIFSMSGNLIKMKCVCGSSELVVQMLKDNKFKVTVPCILCPNSHSFTLSSGTFFQKDLFALSCKFTAINICFIGKGNKVYDALKKNEEELMQTFAAYEEEYGEVLDDLSAEDLLFDDDYFNEYDDFDDDFDDIEDAEEFDDDFDGDFSHERKKPGFVLYKNKKFVPGSDNPDNYDNYENSGDTELKAIKNTKNIEEIENIKIGSYQIVSQILDILSQLYDKDKIFCKCGNLDGKIVILNNAVHIECKNCGSYRNIKASNVSDTEYLNDIDALYLDYDDK
ncbi:MAG: hypothetical protein FWF92_08780 [Oscillospiraceae bacterium]|nr:hypothetical protein [Oscillospiraceae bacterium]